jgi:hypothetical protein
MPHDDASLSSANPDLTVAERRVLERIFQHPVSHNLSWREVFELFRATGKVEHAHNGNVVLKIGSHHLTFEPAHHKDLSADDVMALRHFLTKAGWTPTSMPASNPDPSVHDRVIVIDHSGARVYPAGFDHGPTPDELHHLHHHILATHHDADREEGYPSDTHFFEAIAKTMPDEGHIIIISHGKGQSNEGDHLMAHMASHQGDVHARVAGQIVADLPHTTVPQLLALARDALRLATAPVAAGSA